MRGGNKIQYMDCLTGTYNKSHSRGGNPCSDVVIIRDGLYVAQLAAVFFRYTTQKPRANKQLKIPIK